MQLQEMNHQFLRGKEAGKGNVDICGEHLDASGLNVKRVYQDIFVNFSCYSTGIAEVTFLKSNQFCQVSHR